MKKLSYFALMFVLLVGTLVITANAAEVASGTCGENVNWSLHDSGTLTISGTGDMYDYVQVYDPDSGTFTDGTPWLEYRHNITSAIVKEGITNVGRSIFSELGNLKSVTLPNTIVSIKDWAFGSCYGALTSVAIPDSVKYIGESAFYNCNKLASVTIPESVIYVGKGAFERCPSLTDVYYGGSESAWNAIYADAASDVLAAGICTFGKGNEEFTYESGTCGESITWKLYNDDTLVFTGQGGMTHYGPDEATPWNDFAANITTVIIFEGIFNIGNNALKNLSALEYVMMPSSLNSFGGGVFRGCTSLKQITIPSKATTIWPGAFEGCTALEEITVPSGVTVIMNNAFRDCTNLKTVTLASNITIENGAFNGSGVRKVCYNGSADDWSKMTINEGNAPLVNATKYYSVSTSSGLSGDFDNDGALTLSDTVILARTVAGWSGYEQYLPVK